MYWGFLFFLADPWFVIPWYALGILGMGLVFYDGSTRNAPAMKCAWAFIVLFSSVLGIILYHAAARSPAREQSMLRRVNRAVVRSLAGGGLGIMTGMVLARALGMSFWQEFWLEYVVGVLSAWLLFQYPAVAPMARRRGKALLRSLRSELFSMLTVMAGVGVVTGFMTPLAVGQQPKPLTFAFWGFATLGLLMGYAFTLPMKWMMVRAGWARVSQPELRGKQYVWVPALVALGAMALFVPGWLAEVRQARAVEPNAQMVQWESDLPGSVAVLSGGLRASLTSAANELRTGNRTLAVHTIDAALLGAEVGERAVPDSPFSQVLAKINESRHALHMGNKAQAIAALEQASAALRGFRVAQPPAPQALHVYLGAAVVNANGTMIGEVTSVNGGQIELTLGGWRNSWGVFDLSSQQKVRVPADLALFGPARTLGTSLVALPTLAVPPFTAARSRPTVRGLSQHLLAEE